MGEALQAWLQARWKLGFLVPEHFAMLCLALLAGLWLAIRTAERRGLDRERVFAAALWIAAAALIGARLPYQILEQAVDWRQLVRHPLVLLMPWEGGFSSFAGLAAGMALVPWAARRHGLSPIALLDALAPSAALGLAIARMGCWLTGCCFGSVSDLLWAQRFPPGSFAAADQLKHGWIAAGQASLPVHPLQLYEALFLLSLLAVLVWETPRARTGRACALFFFGYPLGRFFLDGLRADESALALGLNSTRLAALAILFAGASAWAAWAAGWGRGWSVGKSASLAQVLPPLKRNPC